MNRRLVLVADLDPAWAAIVRELESAGLEIDVVGPGMPAADVTACATRGEAVVVVELAADPAAGLALVRACTHAPGTGPVIAVATNPSLELTREIRLSGAFYLALQPVSLDEIRSAAESAFASLDRRRANTAARRASRRILLVDDDEDFAASMSALLRGQGYSVTWERNGRDGLERARAEHPDLIVVDVMMEHDSSGYELNESVKFLPEYEDIRNVPILMVSSIETDPATRFGRSEEVALVTPNAYLTKPLDIPRFLAEVSSLLGEPIDTPVRLTA
jgi:two-component system cell cycle response regulator DivK